MNGSSEHRLEGASYELEGLADSGESSGSLEDSRAAHKATCPLRVKAPLFGRRIDRLGLEAMCDEWQLGAAQFWNSLAALPPDNVD